MDEIGAKKRKRTGAFLARRPIFATKYKFFSSVYCINEYILCSSQIVWNGMENNEFRYLEQRTKQGFALSKDGALDECYCRQYIRWFFTPYVFCAISSSSLEEGSCCCCTSNASTDCTSTLYVVQVQYHAVIYF